MKKGPEKFTQHENSHCHRNASEKLLNVKRIGIDALLSKQVQEEQERARKALLIMFSIICFLGRQGLSFQGHEEETGAFHNMVRERMLTDPMHQNYCLGFSIERIGCQIQSKMR